ncbi:MULTISPECIES: hypothetical protein [Thermoanaerobacterium]|uniref:Uncharacterized protein n=3 Tax=Thermoanaerobacterium TaxID=28895 RepID=L0IQ93_THETR|nr:MULTISPECIES: hypothetical protein [Thermoanaerobacterium]AFK94340.1 hypothetical protein Tsac_2793 [Thermoanaerobacterium saccharolyticum JW/SL-YS485]AGB20376.1 hypothetical protein Thethe_02825 [Thermoanaerobacterium thermosaccharolyticum M0795]ETO39110.1 hypothetical protein V518_0698 [Thermoanaerobacterium aotearoense SCUT27]
MNLNQKSNDKEEIYKKLLKYTKDGMPYTEALKKAEEEVIWEKLNQKYRKLKKY